MLKMGDLLQ